MPNVGWSRTPEKMQELIDRDELIWGSDETTQPQRKVFLTADSKRQMPSVISESGRGKIDLDKLGLDFPYGHPIALYKELLAAAAPKVDALALDFFAGSGTTGHAVIDLNREDGGRRKYLLAENRRAFRYGVDAAPQKAVYSQDWKDGKPVSRKGVSQLFQYVRLESYEDTMDSLEAAPLSDEQTALFDENPEMAEDYRLRYAMRSARRRRAAPACWAKVSKTPSPTRFPWCATACAARRRSICRRPSTTCSACVRHPVGG